MKAEEKAQELYPNNSTFCGGVAQIARDAFAKGARMQKEVDDKELSEKVSAAYQLGLADKEKQMMAVEVKWLVDDDYHEATEKGRFILGSVGIGYNGYYIPYSDLLKLPKEDGTE